VAEPLARAGRALALALLLVASIACRSQEDQLREHRRQLHSLRSTTVQVGNAWLTGQVSSTYAVAALETTSSLIEQERASLGSNPERLGDRSMTMLLGEIDDAVQTIGALIRHIDAGAQSAVQQQLSTLVGPEGPQ
jgi:hypothetical protein